MCVLFFREARRIVYVPFTGESIRGVTPTEISRHIEFKKMLHSGNLSAAVGKMISLRTKFESKDGQSVITNTVVPFVAKHVEGALPDIILTYSNALWFTYEVSYKQTFYIFMFLYTERTALLHVGFN